MVHLSNSDTKMACLAQRFFTWTWLLFFFLSPVFYVHPISSTFMNEDTTSSLAFCPFQTGDTSIFTIWGEWKGENPAQTSGNISGELFIKANFRNESLLIIYEQKQEIISGIINNSNICWPNNPDSYWSYNPKTRHGIVLDTYAWMWVAPPDLQIDTNITIFNYPFLVVRKVDFPFNGSLRPTMLIIYATNSTFETGEYRLNEIHFQFDLQSGLMMYYLIQTNAYFGDGTLYDSGFYSISLNRTTIDLDTTYGPSFASSSTNSRIPAWTLHCGVVALSFGVLWKIRRKKG